MITITKIGHQSINSNFEVKALKTERWVMRKVFMSQSIKGIITDIKESKAVAVSDGSFKE